MPLRQTIDAGRGVVPPLLCEKERLIDQIVWPSLPIIRLKTPVLRQWRDAGWRSRIRAALCGIDAEASGVAKRLLDQLQLFSRQNCEMRQPIEGLFSQHRRAQTKRQPRQVRFECMIDTLVH